VAAGVISVGVTTGMHDARELADAGADHVFSSLTEFPAWIVTVTATTGP
jgi:phosphoglycolate phosphatase-like HAD superfamily hydrolase